MSNFYQACLCHPCFYLQYARTASTACDGIDLNPASLHQFPTANIHWLQEFTNSVTKA